MRKQREVIAINIKRLRKQRGVTQADLASEAGISHRGLQDIESAKSSARESSLESIAEALHVTTRDLMTTPEEAGHIEHAVANYLQRMSKLSPEQLRLMRAAERLSAAQVAALAETAERMVKLTSGEK